MHKTKHVYTDSHSLQWVSFIVFFAIVTV